MSKEELIVFAKEWDPQPFHIDEWSTPNPLRPGDTLHAVDFVESKRESSSKPNLGILTSVSQLVNQNGDIILTYKSNGLVLKRPV